MKPRPLTLLIKVQLVLLAALDVAQATCHGCQASPGHCVQVDDNLASRYGCFHVDDCLEDCDLSYPENVEERQGWGAIARSLGAGTLGKARGFADQRSAESAAVQDCIMSENAVTTCEVVVYFHDACGAVAESINGIWTAGVGGSAAQARESAMQACASHGGANCIVAASLCSDG